MTDATRAVATAPVRVADVGGWTDTWFGAPGQVCHLAVGPGVRVEAGLVDAQVVEPGGAGASGSVVLHAPDLEPEPWTVAPSPSHGWAVPLPGRHPLLEHAVAEVLEGAALPPGAGVEVQVRSAVPPGASLGTSAAVVVALLGALDALVGAERSPEDLARAAHQIETARARRESGVQDQWAAACGGAALLAIGPYPDVRRRALAVPAAALAELGDRLVTVVFGAHDSSAVHRQVIDALVTCSGVEHHHAREALRSLSGLAVEAAVALEAGDIDGWATVLRRSVAAQAALHPHLVGAHHQAAIDVAHELRCAGWKVNGAGGEGGSLTIVLGAAETSASRSELIDALVREDPAAVALELRPAPGLEVRVG